MPENSSKRRGKIGAAGAGILAAGLVVATLHGEKSDVEPAIPAGPEQQVEKDAGVEELRDGFGRAIKFVVQADAGERGVDEVKQSEHETEFRILDDVSNSLKGESRYEPSVSTLSHAGGPFDVKFFRLDIYVKSDSPGLPLAEITAHAEDGTVSVLFRNLCRSSGTTDDEAVKEEVYGVEPYQVVDLLRDIDGMQQAFEEEKEGIRNRYKIGSNGQTVYTMTDEQLKRFDDSIREQDVAEKKAAEEYERRIDDMKGRYGKIGD
jgi:hypothetical protein